MVGEAGGFIKGGGGLSRSKEPEEGPGSELVTTMPISSMSLGVRRGENIVGEGR